MPYFSEPWQLASCQAGYLIEGAPPPNAAELFGSSAAAVSPPRIVRGQGGFASREHAERAIACVNACVGIPSEALTAGGIVRGVAELLLDYRLALQPVEKEIRDKAHGDIGDGTWNEDFHIELTLSIAECKAVLAVLKRARR